jgi:mannan endo-1,4-beta-mannosidase
MYFSRIGFIAFLFTNIMCMSVEGRPFIRVEGAQFFLGDQPYYFLGANFWYGMNLASAGEGGDRARLLRELDMLSSLGVCNLRVMATSEGPESEPWRMKPALQPAPGEYNEALLEGLDFLLAEMGKRDMHAVVCLSNFWHWSGGMAQYRAWYDDSEIPYPDIHNNSGWLPYMLYTAGFYKRQKPMKAYERHLGLIVGRVNAYTGRPYKDDPTIMAWQLANEPRGMLKPKAYRNWIKRSAKLIKQLDPNHLVCVGSEGNTNTPTGNRFKKDHSIPNIDYTTIHIWIQNWGWYDPKRADETYEKAVEKAEQYLFRHLKAARKLNKPLVLEEFGIARDEDNHDPAASVVWRDRYYTQIFSRLHDLAKEGSPAAGANFWAWGGEGRPRAPRCVWERGDPWTGDPPHEFQGWYSVYDRDNSTLAIIQEYALKMKALR